MYCDTSKIVIERCNKETVYNIVKKKHYAKTWTASSNIYGIYYDSGEHQFFDGKQLKLIQTGRLQNYMLFALIGVIMILIFQTI